MSTISLLTRSLFIVRSDLALICEMGTSGGSSCEWRDQIIVDELNSRHHLVMVTRRMKTTTRRRPQEGGTSIEPHFVNSYPAYSFNLEESLILQLLVLAFCHYFSAHFDFPAINSQLQFTVLFISWLHYNWKRISFADTSRQLMW